MFQQGYKPLFVAHIALTSQSVKAALVIQTLLLSHCFRMSLPPAFGRCCAHDQSSVIVEVVLSRGITPTAIVIFGLTVPEYRILPVPVIKVPTQKCVMGPPGDAVHSPKSILAAGLTLLFVTTHPPLVLSTGILAYPVYAASLVVWLPASPGSAV